MSRPPLRKSGAMSDAERQRRHRKKVAKEKREAELAVTRQHNWEKLNDPVRQARLAERQAQHEATLRRQYEMNEGYWETKHGRPPLSDATGPADELVRQIDEFMSECEITIDDVRAAIDRRFGKADA